MKLVAENIPENEIAKILVNNGISFDPDNPEFSLNDKDTDRYFWTKKDKSGVVMEKAVGVTGNCKSDVYEFSNEEFVDFWNERADFHENPHIEMVEPGVFKNVKGNIYTLRSVEDYGKTIKVYTVIARNEESAKDYCGLERPELIETPEDVIGFIKKIEEEEPDFLREIYEIAPFIIAKNEISRWSND